MKYLKRLGAFWAYAFMLVTVLFIVSTIIYGFDIKSSGTRKALTSQLKNSGKVNYFYRINDEFAFGVFTDRAPGEYDIIVTSYMQNYVPFCYFCGYSTGDVDNDQGITQPYKQGNLLYDIEALTDDYMGLPMGAFATLDIDTGTFSRVMDLNEIGPDASEKKYRVTRNEVSANFDEISYSSADDEACMIAFGAGFLSYSILIIWGLLAILFRRIKT